MSIDADSAELEQPLVNEACINATGAAEDCDESEVFVAEPPLAETSVPTAPRTDVLDSSGTSNPGLNMGLVLAFLGIVTLAVAFLTPGARRTPRQEPPPLTATDFCQSLTEPGPGLHRQVGAPALFVCATARAE